MAQPMIVIGVGNELRRDDAVGLAVLRALRDRDLPANGDAVTLREASGEGATLMETWQGADVVILVDAVCSDGEPGTVYRFDAHEQILPSQFFNYSTHAFSVAEAVELARALGQLPPHLIVYGIEGSDYDTGAGLSAPVDASVETVADQILDDLHRHHQPPTR
jgi:hydrogenase maturation protease